MAAKVNADAAGVSAQIISEISQGVFAPVYLLMGEEPYYVDMTAGKIIEAALTEDERDFNQFIMYGLETEVEDVIGNARRYPMFAQRNLVVLREAQMLKRIEELAVYTENPLDSTVLVIIYRGKLDARKALYKSIAKCGKILESNPVRDYEMPKWIKSYYASRGLSIDDDGAVLLAESVGPDMGKVVLETDKMLKNLPEGTVRISAADIESNVGISREFSIFELTRQLSLRQTARAIDTAGHIADSARFAMPPAIAALFNHFYRILRYEALLQSNPHPSPDQKRDALPGVLPFFYREYDDAVRNYPLPRCMKVIELLRDYDFKGKGGDCGEATPGELLVELVTKILTV